MTISNTKLPLFLSRWLYYVSSIFTILFGISPKFKVIKTFLGQNQHPFVITIKSGLQFRVRSAMDIWVIKETCLDRDYEKYGTQLLPDWVIVDIGGGLGDFTLLAANRSQHLVHTYEPFPQSRTLLKENIDLNQINNVLVHEEAVGARHGQLHLATSTGVAVRHSATQHARETDLVVASIPLGDVIARTPDQKIDFLKMDCEGAEYDIILNVDDQTLRAIARICMEYHDDLTPHTHHELVTFLSEKGFVVQTYRNPAHEEIGFLYAENQAFKA